MKPDHERYDMRAIYWLLALVVAVLIALAGYFGSFLMGDLTP